MPRHDQKDQQLLAHWAADCAERVLKLFTATRPNDERPAAAIAAARAWGCGEMRVGEARKAAFAAHAAARDTDDECARSVARAAGHAAATAHVANHARHAAAYAIKAVANVEAEREWQRQHLAPHLQSVVFTTASGE